MAVRYNYIFPECHVDTNIMKTLLHVDGVNHQKGCPRLLSVMAAKFSDRFAVGVIDDDKKKPSEIKNFTELATSSHLKLLKHIERPHYLLIVSKAAEDFLLSSATELGVSLQDYDLPNTLEELKAVTKNTESDKEPKIKKLVNAVRGASEMSRLERTLSYLQANQYHVEDDELVKVFNQ